MPPKGRCQRKTRPPCLPISLRPDSVTTTSVASCRSGGDSSGTALVSASPTQRATKLCNQANRLPSACDLLLIVGERVHVVIASSRFESPSSRVVPEGPHWGHQTHRKHPRPPQTHSP